MKPDTLPLIYNPAAGARGRRKAARAIAALERLGASVTALATTGTGSATELTRAALAEGHSRIVVAGGDGTLNEAINGIAGSGACLAIIPTGTANVLAQELGIPGNIRRACETALRGETLRLDLGRAGGRYFALMAGFGFDAMVIKNIHPLLKRAVRRAAFPVAGLKTYLAGELPLLRVTAGERVAEGCFVVVANSRYYGGRFGPTPDASMTDGLLDICVLKEKGFTHMIDFWYRALKTGQPAEGRVEYMRCDRLEVSAPGGETVPAQVDGEVFGELPLEVSVAPGALCAVVGAGR